MILFDIYLYFKYFDDLLPKMSNISYYLVSQISNTYSPKTLQIPKIHTPCTQM